MSAYYGHFLRRRGRCKGKHRQAGLNNPSDGRGKGRDEFNKENKAKYKREQLWNGVNETKY